MTAIQDLHLPTDAMLEKTAEQARHEVDTLRDYLKNLPEKGWLNQSFCTEWTIKDVVEHQAMQGLLFRYDARLILKNEEILPVTPGQTATYRAEIADLNRLELADLLAETAYEFYDLLEQTTPEQMQQKVQTPFGKVEATSLASLRLSELSLHSWDIRVVDNLATKISRESLPLLFPGLVRALPVLAHRETVKQSEDLTYQFEIEGPVKGPLAVTLAKGKIKVLPDYAEHPDVVLKLDADTFLRLSWGRLRNLDKRIRDGWVKLDGNLDTALKLSQIFQGV